jgi:SAM-dependent methyltransferase
MRTAAEMHFTAHNIELPSGEQTMPDQPLIREWGLCRSALKALRFALPIEDDANPPTVVDLGCLEGGYALEFALAGYAALGIEARASNVERCEFVAKAFALPNLRFACDDARNVASYGEFDAVFCAGLLYHLDSPAAFLSELAKATKRVLLLETHYATYEDNWDQFQLSKLTTHEGRLGRWYKEWESDATPEEIEAFSWSSVGNPSSFWLEKRNLLQAMLEAGFPIVCEQYDFLDDIVENDFRDRMRRSLFLGLKPSVGQRVPEAIDSSLSQNPSDP